MARLRTDALVGIGLFTAAILLIAIFGGLGSVGGFLGGAAVCCSDTSRAGPARAGRWSPKRAFSTGCTWSIQGATIVGAPAVMVPGRGGPPRTSRPRSLWLPLGLHFGWNFAEPHMGSPAVERGDPPDTGEADAD